MFYHGVPGGELGTSLSTSPPQEDEQQGRLPASFTPNKTSPKSQNIPSIQFHQLCYPPLDAFRGSLQLQGTEMHSFLRWHHTCTEYSGTIPSFFPAGDAPQDRVWPLLCQGLLLAHTDSPPAPPDSSVQGYSPAVPLKACASAWCYSALGAESNSGTCWISLQ